MPPPGRGLFHVRGWLMLLPDPGPDDETYLTAAQAARVFGVAASTFTGWVRKGYVAAVPGSSRRLYRLPDVACAEKKARDAAIRTSGTTKRVRRHHEAA